MQRIGYGVIHERGISNCAIINRPTTVRIFINCEIYLLVIPLRHLFQKVFCHSLNMKRAILLLCCLYSIMTPCLGQADIAALAEAIKRSNRSARDINVLDANTAKQVLSAVALLLNDSSPSVRFAGEVCGAVVSAFFEVRLKTCWWFLNGGLCGWNRGSEGPPCYEAPTSKLKLWDTRKG